MIDPLVRPPIVKQCELLNLSRSTYYYAPKGESDKSLKLMDKIDRIYMEHPFMGSRQITATLWHSGIEVNRKRVQRLMGISSIAPSPNTTKPKVDHHKYPYLLRDLAIEHPNQVWATDITYIPMSKGFMYLVAILDLHSRKVLSWRISNTMTVDFCIQALREAIRVHGIPEIFNTDQGSQFTADEFTSELVSHGIMISMDGKGRDKRQCFRRAPMENRKVRACLHQPCQRRAGTKSWTQELLRVVQHDTSSRFTRQHDT